jgi:hypothetical protein
MNDLAIIYICGSGVDISIKIFFSFPAFCAFKRQKRRFENTHCSSGTSDEL